MLNLKGRKEREQKKNPKVSDFFFWKRDNRQSLLLYGVEHIRKTANDME